jgi:hypothetical protein
MSDLAKRELIVVKQLPIIEQQLKSISEDIQVKVDEALSLSVTEDTVKAVKKQRTELTKMFNDLEDRRKAVKSAVMEPYNEFEAVYKQYVTDIFKPADTKLKAKIDEVQEGIKREKADEVESYFAEYCQSKNIDFLTFADTGIRVGLSDSMKSLKERSAEFVDKVADDLALIETQEHKAEILVEYKKTLNASQAITSVKARLEAVEAERIRQEALAEERKRQEEAKAKVQEVIQEPVAPPEIVEVPAVAEEPEVVEEKVFIAAFKVFGTLEQLKSLKSFMDERGYRYEQAKF